MDFLSTDQRIKNLTLFVAMMSVLRCVSFGLEYCWRAHEKQKDKQPELYSLLDLLVYNFYFPVFVNGPVITFETFQKTVSRVECLWSTCCPHGLLLKYLVLCAVCSYVCVKAKQLITV